MNTGAAQNSQALMEAELENCIRTSHDHFTSLQLRIEEFKEKMGGEDNAVQEQAVSIILDGIRSAVDELSATVTGYRPKKFLGNVSHRSCGPPYGSAACWIGVKHLQNQYAKDFVRPNRHSTRNT